MTVFTTYIVIRKHVFTIFVSEKLNILFENNCFNCWNAIINLCVSFLFHFPCCDNIKVIAISRGVPFCLSPCTCKSNFLILQGSFSPSLHLLVIIINIIIRFRLDYKMDLIIADLLVKLFQSYNRDSFL